MAQILIRNLDEAVKAKIRERARRHGRSTEEEARQILRSAVDEGGGPPEPLGRRIGGYFKDAWLESEVPELRGHAAKPADLSS